MAQKSIEVFFLNTLLKISIIGVSIILVVDFLLLSEDAVSLLIDSLILSTCIIAFLLRNKYPTFSIIIVNTVVLSTMIFQCLMVPINTTTSLSILLVVGFINSVMLKHSTLWIMHGLTFGAIQFIFYWQFSHPHLRFSDNLNDVLTVSVTYSILYFILAAAAAGLKRSYDKIHSYLHETNKELQAKANEIVAQNEKLLQVQESLNTVNSHLEQMVNERTAKVKEQHEILLKYSYTNAHKLRGPVARLLGLANLYTLETPQQADFIIEKMREQANEIDGVVKQINIDLDVNQGARE